MDDDILKTTELRSEEIKDLLSEVPNRLISWGSAVIFMVIVLLIVLSFYVRYPDVIVGDAILTTQISPHKEYAQITGKFDTILVQDSQIVEEKQILAVLQNTADYDDIVQLKTIVAKVNIEEDDFYFPLDSVPNLNLGILEESYALFVSNYTEYILNVELQPFNNCLLYTSDAADE